MTFKTIFAALILAASPGFAVATGCSGSHATQEAQISCPVGQTWDEAAEACTPEATA